MALPRRLHTLAPSVPSVYKIASLKISVMRDHLALLLASDIAKTKPRSSAFPGI